MLPGSRWWRRISPLTQTPIHAVWLVYGLSAICGLLAYSPTAFNSLAGYIACSKLTNRDTDEYPEHLLLACMDLTLPQSSCASRWDATDLCRGRFTWANGQHQ